MIRAQITFDLWKTTRKV